MGDFMRTLARIVLLLWALLASAVLGSLVIALVVQL